MKIRINDQFWLRYRELVRNQMLPFQWKVLNDIGEINIERERADESLPAEKSHAIANFEIASGRREGEHYGWVFQDSDVYKWLEAVGYSLMENMEEELKKKADYVVDLIGDAQQSDGYIHTYYTIKGLNNRYTRLAESHELYCAGHFLEAAVSYYLAAENQKVLEIAIKWADHLCETFGNDIGKIAGYDGHEEVKIGLMKLYDLTGEERYLKLARFFLEIRGVQETKEENFLIRQYRDYPDAIRPIPDVDPNNLRYFQADMPVSEMMEAHGHAVRVVYLCNALARIAYADDDSALKETSVRLWNNITKKQMYITGGIGATVIREAFTFEHDLPNDTMYCETCASVGLVMLAYQMLKLDSKGEYGDVMERALYNTCLAGMALDGKHFFYVNPLSVNPESYRKDITKSHVKPVRPEWLGCACCPPNLARLLASLEQYAYIQKEEEIVSILFMNTEANFTVAEGNVSVKQYTKYPEEGTVTYEITLSDELIRNNRTIRFGIRIPAWAREVKLVQGDVNIEKKDGIWYFECVQKINIFSVEMSMEAQRWYANPEVRSDVGKVAISRGPFIYCLEGVDNGDRLHLLSLPREAELEYYYDKNLLGGVGVIEAEGYRKENQIKSDELYYRNECPVNKKSVKMRWIPYYAWANRGENEMQVWVNEV